MNIEYRKVKQWYKENVNDYANKSAVLLYDKLKYFISRVPKNGRILDVGCGPGHDTEYFAQKGFQSIGIDFSPDMVDYAKKNRSVGIFKKIDMLKIDKYFPGNYFDGVWASSSITHLKKTDIPKALEQMKKAILPQRPIVIIVKMRTKRKSVIRKGIIFNEFYKKDIKYYLKRSGLFLRKIETFTALNSKWLFVHAEKK